MKTKFFILNSHSKFQILNSKFFSSRSARKGFTLMELLMYAGILAISAGLVSGIVYTISRANLKTQAEEAVNNQMMRLEEIFRQKIESAKSVNSISGSYLSLEMSDSAKDPTVFSLSNDTVYLQEGSGSQVALNDSNEVKVTSLSFVPTGASGAAVSDTYHYAWNDQVGWIDWAYPGGNIRVPIGEGDLDGGAYIVSEGSWISLNCNYTDSCSTVDYKVSSDADGNLSGWAWSDNYGWISFSCTDGGSNGEDICSTSNYGVTVSTSTGEFDGYAWSENIGWISFNCKTGGSNGGDICSTSDYKVQDLRTKTSAIKVDVSLQYNSTKPELSATKSNTFVFNLINANK